MEVVETFGQYVDKLSNGHPKASQWLLRTGWEAQSLRLKYRPERRLMPADQYLAQLMMQMMLRPLKNPKDSVIVSIFTPCELLQELGLYPYNVEGFSSFLSGSKAERDMLEETENQGLSETLCSYHKTFLGAADKGILPKPRCIVFTNLTCDANMLTFRRLARQYRVPSFFIDVPMQADEESVSYVADQLRDLAKFLQKQTGRKVDEDRLKERMRRSHRTMENIRKISTAKAGKDIPNDLVTPMYCGITGNLLLGTAEEERYTRMLLRDIKRAPATKSRHIYWMHTIPFWSDAVKQALCFNADFQIAGCELSEIIDREIDPGKPYEAMAMRMVYSYYNGPITRRIEAGIRYARACKADAAIWFNHWGCKHTMGGAQLAKKKFEEQGIPLLILDGDGCDRSHGGEGQTATRLGAFLEMLEGESVE